MSRSIVRDILEALEVQHINELMDDGKHYIIEVCRRITSENKHRIKELDAENVKLRICLWNLAADPDHVKGMANRIEQLQAQVDALQKDVGFYKCCALSGEIPKEGSQPSAAIKGDK